jgi:hydrogenase 3 maturation protease
MERKRILPPSWKELLHQKLNQFKSNDRLVLPRTCLVGIGSDLRGDDSVGLIVARSLLNDERFTNMPHLLVVDGGPAPENHTGKIRAFQPGLVLFIDAAQMDELPGTIQWIQLDAIDGMSASSHSLPLSMLARYLTLEIGCEVAVLGIQPEQNEIGAELSSPVRVTVDETLAGISEMLFL